MAKRSEKTTPIVELDPLAPVAVIISAHPLLGTYLHQTLVSQSLQTIFISSDSPPSSTPLSHLTRVDYVCLVYPHLFPPTLFSQLLSQLPSFSAKTLLIENYRQQSSPALLKPFLDLPKTQLAYVLDPYGPLSQTYSIDPISSLISAAALGQPLTVSPQPKNLLYPTHVNDLLPAFVKLLFGHQSSSEPFFISSADGLTQLDFAQLLQNLSLEITHTQPSLEFSSLPPAPLSLNLNEIIRSQASLNWEPRFPLEEGIRQTLSALKQHPLSTHSTPPPPQNLTHPTSYDDFTPIKPPPPKHHLLHLPKLNSPRPHLFRRHKLVFLAIFTLLISLFVPPTLFLTYGYLGSRHLKQAFTTLEQGSPTDAEALLHTSQHELSLSRLHLQFIDRYYLLIPSRLTQKYDSLLDTGLRLNNLLLDSSATLSQAQSFYQAVLNQGEGDVSDLGITLKADLESLYNQLSLLSVSLQNKETSSSLDGIEEIATVKDKLPQLRDRLKLGISLLNALPLLTQDPNPQNYLLVFQNSDELRPTGGYLQSFATLTLTQGKITNFTVSDFAVADRQLSGHVEPPAPLKEHLTPNWLGADSNFDPHFPSSAQQILWFLKKELNQDFAGVIALSTPALKDMLEASGPLNLTGVSATVTASNLSTVLNQYGTLNSSLSPNIHSLTLQAFLHQLVSGSVPLPQLARALDSSLKSSSISLYAQNSELQTYLDALRWADSLKSQPCPKEFSSSCLASTFSLIDANLGLNRVNPFIKRLIDHAVSLGENGQLTHQLAITYQNTATSNQWPQGTYKTYTRLYLPNYPVDRFLLNNQPLPATSLSRNLSNGLVSYGLYFELPPGQSVNLLVTLHSPLPLDLRQSDPSLGVFWHKQSGSQNDSLQFSLNYPSSLNPKLLSLPAQTQSGSLKFATPLNQDLPFAVSFSRL